MRSIKFRAWDKQDEQWIEDWGDIFIDYEGSVYLIEERTWAYQSYMYKENITGEVEVVLSTGLTDKNGKEIYEGDVIEFNNNDYELTAGHRDDDIVIAKVEYSCGAWGLKEADGQLHDLYIALVNDEEAEVIGNRFEHPHLLEGEE